ncbi:MAG: bifunctional [glutamine synthetase] adenylyltransferase/[glutamine synthetase]-adenylyl-L-tyrosine phosphorylase [Microbacteriaceae bacterium]
MAAVSLSQLARAGFTALSEAAARLDEVAGLLGTPVDELLDWCEGVANPDAALNWLYQLIERDEATLRTVWQAPGAARRLLLVLGASQGLAEFFLRRPNALSALREPLAKLPLESAIAEEFREAALDAVRDAPLPLDAEAEERGWVALRERYRHLLARLAAWDLEAESATVVQPQVSSTLADMAAAAIDVAIELSRLALALPADGSARFGGYPAEQVAATRLAVIGMGKSGASELNYVSDVDVIYVAESADAETVGTETAITIATQLAQHLQRAIGGLAVEPPLWEVDPNLRPEGKDGALVRSLDSHLQYYERWAKSWEFQALLKARAMAGDRELGERYVAAVAPKVWASAGRENFVESVQRMRERVTEHIPVDEVDVQLKLGPGGLRDIEFTVQLLQLVHGRADPTVRFAGTLPALAALASAGYVGRAEAAEFAEDYRFLRVLEHRMQLSRLRRTHLMPRDEEALRVLARASGLAGTANELIERWHAVRTRVRGLHERLFYRPLLAVVAAAEPSSFNLSSEQAADRLAAIGFRDPKGAMAHLAALAGGVARRAAIQRALLPVLLQWLAEGADPDYGLLMFRRLSESLGETHWYLRMLRDSSAAAYRLTTVLAGSRFVAELLDLTPESVAWLEDDDELRPRTLVQLREESAAVLSRHAEPEEAARRLRAIRRREVLRLGISAILGTCTIEELAVGLTAVTENHLAALVEAIHTEAVPGFGFAVIGMGRFGGSELGFGSDADVLYVYRAAADDEGAAKRALGIVAELTRLSQDPRLPFELDADLRPEGRNGVMARTLEAYRAYYERWSLTWEAQALLRARFVAGDAALGAEFEQLADRVRYPAAFGEAEVREVRRIKARVENERLPQGADPARHLKLGRGSLSDVEWFVQLLQLQHAHRIAELRTTSTLDALRVAEQADLVNTGDAAMLRDAWRLASRARSALTLWLNKTTDVLPHDRADLEGVARLMEYPPGSASALEEDYLGTTRRARAAFERGFYGPAAT